MRPFRGFLTKKIMNVRLEHEAKFKEEKKLDKIKNPKNYPQTNVEDLMKTD